MKDGLDELKVLLASQMDVHDLMDALDMDINDLLEYLEGPLEENYNELLAACR